MTEPITISEKAGVRYLHFGSEWIQGAMRIRKPDALELDYTREMMLPLLLHEAPWPSKILMIGLGAGSLAKFVLRYLPDARLRVVEISAAVHRIARCQFALPEESSRFRVIIADGADYLNESRSRFDWILVDGFDRNARAGRLESPAFYASCRERLSPRGLLTANLFRRARGHQASIDRLAQAFDRRAIAIASGDPGNVIGIAAGGRRLQVDLDSLRQRAASLRATSGLDLRPALTRLQLSVPLAGGRLAL